MFTLIKNLTKNTLVLVGIVAFCFVAFSFVQKSGTAAKAATTTEAPKDSTYAADAGVVRGIWDVVRERGATTACLYSDERISDNIKHENQDRPTRGMACIYDKKGYPPITHLDAPADSVYDDSESIILGVFDMQDGKTEIAYFAIKPIDGSTTLTTVHSTPQSKTFGWLLIHSKTAAITIHTYHGSVIEHFTNKMIMSDEEKKSTK